MTNRKYCRCRKWTYLEECNWYQAYDVNGVYCVIANISTSNEIFCPYCGLRIKEIREDNNDK